jgi:hypothetical protein
VVTEHFNEFGDGCMELKPVGLTNNDNDVLRAKSGFAIKLKKCGVLCMPMEDWSASDRATAAAVY